MKTDLRSLALLPILAAALLLAGCAPKSTVRVAGPAPGPGSVERLRADLERIFSDPGFANAQWGVEVISLDRGDLLYERNATRLYMPASNNKIVTAAAALARLGPDYRYETRIASDGEVIGGVLKGSLIITGSGDPSLAARFHDGDPFRVFRDWASQLRARGIRKIEGEIIGDARAFPPPFLGSSWEWDDLIYGYAAPVTALQFNENLWTLEVTPGNTAGAPANVKCSPMPEYVALDARITTIAAGEKGRIEIRRGARRESIVATGTIAMGAEPDVTTLAVELPTAYYLAAMKRTLQEEGIDTAGAALRAVEDAGSAPPPQGQTLLSHLSPPLPEILKPLLKVSQNLYAETLARTLGLALRGRGAFEIGRELVQETLERMAIQKDTYAYEDGSGLSRHNLVSADMLIRIFRYMSRQKYFQAFFDALPIAGIDGTIRSRMKGTRAENNVRGKTGTIAYVRCLSGYVKTADGEMLAYAMIANNFLASNQAVEYLQDSALERLANFSRRD
jgi:D-alanyl-D-alanine carboxypeptidase/D-alanyl-D-alanine-endopeptidase (penicillin-binding protein 4)